MKLYQLLTGALLLILCGGAITANPKLNDVEILNRTFHLGGDRTQQEQFFICETSVKSFNPDGILANEDVFVLYLKYIPEDKNGKSLYECSKFEIRTNDTIIRTIPSLAGWNYSPLFEDSAKDKKNQVFGIDHNKFEKLVDQNNQPFPPEKIYMIYNAFIDFHSFCNIFAEERAGLKGIQDIQKVGDKVVHYASFSKPPVNLGSNIKEGSYFENGEIILELMGLSKVNEKETAIVHYDSGESSFKMFIEPMPGIAVNTQGRSHYFGDIFIDLSTKWIQKVIMDEIVIAKAKLPFPPNEVNSITERHSVIRNVSKTLFEK